MANLVKILPFALAISISKYAWAQEVPPPEPQKPQPNIAVLANYSYLDLILPGKIGVTLTYKESPSKSYEFEYLSATIAAPFIVKDLGSFSEKRVTLLSRKFIYEGSFSGYMGISWNSVELALGDRTLSTLSGGKYPDLNLLRLDTLGLNTGLGHRWTVWKGLTLGADWIGWAQPLFVIKNQTSALDSATNDAERHMIERTLNTMTYFPRFHLLKCQLGWSF
jgi:hypothetical protein